MVMPAAIVALQSFAPSLRNNQLPLHTPAAHNPNQPSTTLLQPALALPLEKNRLTCALQFSTQTKTQKAARLVFLS